MRLSKDIEKLVKRFDVDTNAEMNKEVLAELLQAQAEHLTDRKVGPQRKAGREPFVARFPRLAWTCGLAAIFIATVSCFACLVLTRRIADLEHELELVRRDVVVARVEGKLEEARTVRQETISTLYHRVEKLEERIPRIPSASRVYYPEEAYYLPYGRDSL